MLKGVFVETFVERLQRGEVVAYPTETLIALGANPFDTLAVERLIELKERPTEKGIPLIIDMACRVDEWVEAEDLHCAQGRKSLQERFWPGPLTIVFAANSRAREIFSPLIFGSDFSLAVRLSSSPVARELAKGLGGAITSTSANISSRPSATSFKEVRQIFPELLLVDKLSASNSEGASSGNSLASTILDVRKCPFRILREGAIGREQLVGLLGDCSL